MTDHASRHDLDRDIAVEESLLLDQAAQIARLAAAGNDMRMAEARLGLQESNLNALRMQRRQGERYADRLPQRQRLADPVT